jgi:hypothetical protein
LLSKPPSIFLGRFLEVFLGIFSRIFLEFFLEFIQEDIMANSARLSRIDRTRINLPAYDTTVVLTGTVLLIVFALAVYLAALQPGNWPDGIALMAAFP